MGFMMTCARCATCALRSHDKIAYRSISPRSSLCVCVFKRGQLTCAPYDSAPFRNISKCFRRFPLVGISREEFIRYTKMLCKSAIGIVKESEKFGVENTTFNSRRILIPPRKEQFCWSMKIQPDTDLKIILLDHQNNYVSNWSIMSDVTKNFNIPAVVWAFYIIILMVQQNYFQICIY